MGFSLQCGSSRKGLQVISNWLCVSISTCRVWRAGVGVNRLFVRYAVSLFLTSHPENGKYTEDLSWTPIL
jgi:hypothetical protein